MKRLILMRHAKSDWSGGASTDHARGLNARGRQGADSLGKWLKNSNLEPDQVLCSTAQRTQETLARLHLPSGIPTELARALYLASAENIRKVLRSATGNVVLMLGHNPGIAACAIELLATPPDHPRFDQYPTGATLVADFPISDWDAVDWRSGKVVQFVTPHDLPEDR